MKKSQKSRTSPRVPRMRVPNHERALFFVDGRPFVGVLQRLSLTGGSAVLSRGPIRRGTMGDIAIRTDFGKVSAHIQFLQMGAEGMPLAQAFCFLAMEDVNRKRLTSAVRKMEKEGYSDAPRTKASPLSAPASQALGQLLHSVRRLAATLVASRASAKV